MASTGAAQVGVGINFLRDALEELPGDTVRLDVVDPSAPIRVATPVDENLLVVLMPRRC